MHKEAIYKAQGVGDRDTESLLIEFSVEIPFPLPTAEVARKTFKYESLLLEKLLHDVLPGGTYDALLRKMLGRRASQLGVSHGGLQ